MPTAGEFRAAAAELRAVSSTVAGLSGTLDEAKTGSGMIGRSGVRTKLEAAIETASSYVPTCASSLEGVATDLEWRASQCDAYRQELRRWEVHRWQLEQAGLDPNCARRPVKKYAWIDL